MTVAITFSQVAIFPTVQAGVPMVSMVGLTTGGSVYAFNNNTSIWHPVPMVAATS